MNKAKKILIVPLDWGLGHATRCIPIINTLISAGCEVIIAGSEETNSLLAKEFPDLRIVSLIGYRIKYSQTAWKLPFVLGCQLPKIIKQIQYENLWLKQFIAEENIDAIISDNRYGLYHDTIPSVIITHQLTIQVPQSAWVEQWVNNLHRKRLAKFSEIWVPDYKQQPMAGKLSQSNHLPQVKHLGNLSRFNFQSSIESQHDLLILLSGPEPQRTLLEQKIIQHFTSSKLKILIVRGKPHKQSSPEPIGNLQFVNHLSATALQTAILSAAFVICRSGYSTIMDLIKLNKHALIIPTPGQTEQEYLGEYLSQQGWFCMLPQHEIKNEALLNLLRQYKFSDFPQWNMESYKQVIHEWLKKLN